MTRAQAAAQNERGCNDADPCAKSYQTRGISRQRVCSAYAR
jgi:hypothetical protein